MEIVFVIAAVVWLFLFGRVFCGKVCPLGFLQDIIYKIPFPKKIKNFRTDKYLRLLKFVYLAFQIVLSVTALWGLTNAMQQETVTVPSVVMPIAAVIFLFIMVLLRRPFCKYFCPVGAVSALGNKISRYKYRIKQDSCIKCGVCRSVCPMSIEPYKTPNALECIRCGRCIQTCPKNAIISGFHKTREETE